MNAFEVVQPRPVRGGWSLRGYKGKGGGGGARQPVEAADSLHSTSYARVLDLLSEGEIAGLVNGLQSIYLNNTPLANADGSFNFAGVTADFRAGFQTQDPIPGFPSAESPAAVGVELKAATPWVRSILNRNLSAVRVTLGVDGLSKANTENGDISGHTVNYAIDLQTDGGAWVEVLAAAFTGKTTQQYRRTHRIDLPTAVTSWTLRVRRVTPNANSNTVADTTVIESITEVIDAKLRYPMSALVGLQVDASQFRGSVPTRAYHCRGRIIRVPSNYDPVMRSYAGIWDGTFKSAYSNNPAWVFYDLATNDRYGLGKRIPAGWINKWSLYQIGVYCDGMVSNGRGGVEPRFTCNAYLQSRGDATRVLQDLCSIFRGMVYWAAGAAVPVADMPRDPAVTYSQADVIDGRFSYSGSRLKDRHTVALVSYNDMTDFGRQKVFPYQDDAAVARYGIRKVEISAFGCTSEAQAQRVGQWAVLTAQRETRSVSFSLGLKGTLCSPGQVIEIADSAFAGRRMGGLLKSATAAKVVLDAPVTARAGDSITVMLPSGVAQSRRIAYLEMIDGVQHVSVNPAFDAAPVTESSWAISTAEVATQLFTVLSVTEGTGPGLTFDVSAIQHEPGKFAAIDQGALLPERPVSVVPAQVLPTPIGVTVGAHSVTAGDGTVSTTVTAAWQAVAGAAFYDVEWSRSQSDWVRMPRTALTVLEIPNAYTGDYLVRVRAISAIDTVSAWGYSTATPVAATALPPRNFDTFMVSEVGSGMRQYSFAYTTQRPPADLAGAEIRYILGSPVNIDWQQMRPLDDGGYYTNSFESTKPEAGLWTFALRARSRSGVLSEGMLIWRGQLLHNVADVVPDLTSPPAPAGVTGVPLMTTAQVNWASPTYTVGHGHDHSVIYAALWATGGAAPAFSAAKSVGTEQGHPASIPVELGSKYTIWVTHVSVDGVESAPSAGVTFVTAQDVGKLLGVLEGKITESQLYADLAKEIDLISGTGTGSVNARVLAEAQARAQAVAAESNTRAQALAAEASSRAQAVASEAAARGQDVAAMAADLEAATNDLLARIDSVNAQVSDIIGASEFDPAQAYELGQLVKYLNKLYRAKVNTVGNLPTNTTYWDLVGDYASLGEAVAAHAAQLADHANRITQTEQGLTAEASARTTLAAQLRGNYTGSDVTQVTSGLVWSERQARVSGDSANASAIDAVKARMPAGTGKVASEASVIDEATARAAADAAAASRTTVIEARLPAGTGALATAAAVTALDTRVTAAEGSLTSQSGQITSLSNTLTTTTGTANAAQAAAQAASDLAGGKGKVIYSTTAPAVADRQVQNLWIDTTGGANTPKRWTGSAWTAVTDKVATDAAAAAAAAQATANTKADASALTALDSKVTSQGNTLAAQGSSITSLKAGLADGSSVNKLANTAFSPEGKQPTTDANGAIAIIARNQLPADVVAGCPASSCAILNLNAGTGSVLRFPFTDSIHATNANRAVGWAPSGGAVDVGCWVFSPASNISAVRLACWYFKEDSSSAGSAAIAGTTYNKTVGGWQYLSGRANVPADAASMAFTVQVLTGAAGDKIYATEPYVAFPNAASMRADGTAEALTSLTARVTAAEGVNTSQSTSITNLQNSVTSLQSGKADASALSALDSKVTTQGNTLNSQGSAITALQNSITNGPVLPSDFSGGLVNWTGSRQGDPTAVNTVSGTIVTDDADFGVCAQFNNWTSLGIGMLTKGLVQAIPGRVYRVRARFKVVAAPSFPLGMNIVAGGNTAIFASGGDAFSNPVTITVAGQIGEITALFSDKAANAVGAVTWGATAVLLRFGLRLNTALASGLQLRVQSITIEDATADAANADATTALTSRVTTAEGNITSTSGALTTLTNRVTAAEGVNASQATAISGLQTSVTTINGTLTSQGSSITSLSNSLDALQGAGDNLLKASNVELVRAAESYQMGGYTTTETLIQGETYTLVACITHTPASGDVTSSVGAWVNGLKTINQNLVRNGSKVIATATFVFDNSAAAGTLVNFYYYPSTVKTGAATVHWACLYQGKVVPPKAWQPSMAEMGATLQGKADSSALTALASRVTTAEGNISSTSSALTTLTNRVTAAEGVNTSQATAITGLNSSVTTINGTLTSQASQITNLQAGLAEAGGQNLLYNPSFDVVGTLGFADGYQAGGRSAGVTITPSLVPSWIDPVGLAQRIDATGLGTSLYSDLVCITGNSTKPKPTAMEGQRVALSAYVRASAGISVRMYIQARSDQNSNTTIATSTGALETPGENGARVTLVTSALPAGTTALHILFRVFGTGTVSSGWVEWDRAQVELGTTVTAWRDNGVAGLSAVNAAVNTLATASANADAALASRATLLESRMPTGTGQLATAAALTAVDTRVTNIDGRVTSESTRLDQVQAAVGSAAACLQALNPLGGESEWSAVGGATAATFVTVAEPDARGGAVLTVGNGTTSGERWLRHVATIPMDENKLYKLSARFRRTAGDGGIYLGIAGLNAAKSLYVNTSNVETSSISAAHYAINNAKPALGTLQVVEYYFKGRAAGAATGSGTKAAPRAFANKVAHLALMIVGNYQGQVGFFDLDYITLEDVTAAEQASAAIATEATTRATTDGYLGAQYSVRMQLSQGGQQVVGGFGISGTTSGTAGPQIDFGVMANSFWIAAPSGSPGGVSNVKPFVVQTTAQTVNGVSVPAGVYMDAAYINNVTALWARFGNLVADTIQATSISVTKLTAGNLAVGSYINSSNYVNGSAGWSINSNGWAEFSQVTVRGAIYSSAGTIGGITINGNGLNSGGFSGYQWPPAGQSGFHIGPNGILLGNANNGRYIEIQSNGNLYAPGFYIENGNATFWGNISGATGTFSGTLIAQNVVTTGNLQYNSATGIVNSTMMSLLHWPWNSWPGDIITLTVPAADGASITSIHYAYEQIIANQDADILFKIDGVAVFTKTVLGNSSAYNNYISGQMETMEIINVPFTFSGNGSARTLAIEVRPRGGNGYIFFYARFRSITANTSKR